MVLEVSPVDLEQVPKIQHLLKVIGSRAKLFEYLEGSDTTEALNITKLRARLTHQQFMAVPFEAFCLAAKVPVKTMYGIIAAEVMDQGNKASSLMLRARHPEVVKATIDRALKFDGTADAKMLHQANHFVPVPKNTTTIIHGDVVADKSTVNNVAILAPMEDNSRRLADRFMEMEMPAQIEAPLDVEEEESDGEEE